MHDQMNEYPKSLLERISALEAQIAELVRLSTPEGRFEAEQAYLAYRRQTNPFYDKPQERTYTNDARTRASTQLAPIGPMTHSIDGAKGF